MSKILAFKARHKPRFRLEWCLVYICSCMTLATSHTMAVAMLVAGVQSFIILLCSEGKKERKKGKRKCLTKGAKPDF